MARLEEVQARIREASQRAAAGEVFREVLPYWLADGSERLVDFAMHPIRDEMGVVRFLYPTGIDITDRTRAEEALRAREAEEREIAIGLQRALLPGRWSSLPACRSRPVMRRQAPRSRSAGTGTTFSRLRTVGSR